MTRFFNREFLDWYKAHPERLMPAYEVAVAFRAAYDREPINDRELEMFAKVTPEMRKHLDSDGRLFEEGHHD